jgi:adenylate cyclase
MNLLTTNADIQHLGSLPKGAIRVGDWILDARANRLRRGRHEARLEPKVMDLLVYLAARPNEVVSRHELEAAVWQGTVVGYDSVTGAIQKLRRVLEDDRRSPRYIETLSKRGYRFVAPVQAAEPALKDADPPHHPPRFPIRTAAPWTGPYRLLDFALLLLIALSAAGLWVSRAPLTPPAPVGDASPASIAVLPFENLDGNPATDYLAEGVTDDIITGLTKLPGLAVISRDSTFLYGPRETDARAAADALDARYVLYGSIRHTRAGARINAHLVDGASRIQLWAESYTSDDDDLGDLHLRITRDLMAELAPRVSAGMQQDLGEPITADPRAYDEFLIGRQRFYLYLSEAENARAREHFETALELDPDFALARAMLAWTHAFDAMNGWRPDREEALERSLEQAGLALDPDRPLPIAHFVRGLALRELGRFPQATVEAEKAIAADPSYANAHLLLATLLYHGGRPEAGLERIRTAMALNPHHPYNYHFHLGQMYYTLGRYDDAIRAFRRGLESNPASERLHVWLAASLAEVGDMDEARWEAEQVLLANPDFSIAQVEANFPYTRSAWVSRLTDQLRAAGLGR